MTVLSSELREVLAKVGEAGQVYADLVSVLGRTGIRWGEARAMLVSDFIEVPMPPVDDSPPEDDTVRTRPIG